MAKKASPRVRLASAEMPRSQLPQAEPFFDPTWDNKRKEDINQTVFLQKKMIQAKGELESMRHMFGGDVEKFTPEQLKTLHTKSKAYNKLIETYYGALETLSPEDRNKVEALEVEDVVELPRPAPVEQQPQASDQHDLSLNIKKPETSHTEESLDLPLQNHVPEEVPPADIDAVRAGHTQNRGEPLAPPAETKAKAPLEPAPRKSRTAKTKANKEKPAPEKALVAPSVEAAPTPTPDVIPQSEPGPNPLPRYRHRPQSAEANAARTLHNEQRRQSAGTQERPRAADQAGEKRAQESDAFATERAKAEEKYRRHELLRGAIEKVTTEIIDKKAEKEKIPVWKYFARDRIDQELKKLNEERTRLEDELSEKVGFGTKFTESVGKYYKAANKKFQELRKIEEDHPYGKNGADLTTLNLSEAPEKTKPSEEDIARVEAEVRDDQAKAHPTKTFIKQRIKGFFTFGISEFRPAEKYREGTKAAAREMGSLTRLIEQDRGYLNIHDAEDIAFAMRKQVHKEGLDISDPRYLEISAQITEQRIARNDALIKEITILEIKRLEERLKEYRTESGGVIFTEENKDRIAKEIRAHLLKAREGAAEVDVVELTKTIRQTLDDKWKRRYAYGVADLAAWTALFGSAGYFYLSAKEIAVAAAAGGDKVLLEKTLSHIAVKMLHQAGFSHPTQAMIQQVTTAMAIQNKVAVVKGGALLWKATAGGVVKDIAMAKGTPIMIGAAQKAILALKAGMLAGV